MRAILPGFGMKAHRRKCPQAQTDDSPVYPVNATMPTCNRDSSRHFPSEHRTAGLLSRPFTFVRHVSTCSGKLLCSRSDRLEHRAKRGFGNFRWHVSHVGAKCS